jgi:glycosyltransferase involved in cell wall biosynthesis
MKVLQINSTINWGSTGRIAEDIGENLQKIGAESYIAYGRYSNVSRSHGISIYNKTGIFIHALKSRLFDMHGLSSKKDTYALIRKIEEIQPDIIHLHNIHGYYLNYKILFDYLSKKSIPIVWTLHDCWAFTGHCAHYMHRGCIKWKTQCYNCPLKTSYPASYFIDHSRQNYILKRNCFTSVRNMVIVTVSNWLAIEVSQSFLKKYDRRVIYNGVDTNVFMPLNKKSQFNNKFVILGVASFWTKKKGFDDFIQLRKFLPEEFLILLIGVNKRQCKSLPAGIIGIERTNNVTELAEYYSTADVFVNPTWEDNFPTTNIEALACGTPVITYKTGGSPEAVSANTGFIVDQGDLLGVVSAIKNVKLVGKEKYSAACRERAVQHFNKFERYQEYIELYQKILSKK